MKIPFLNKNKQSTSLVKQAEPLQLKAFNGYSFFSEQATSTFTQFSKHQIDTEALTNVIVARCVNLIAQEIACLDPKFYSNNKLMDNGLTDKRLKTLFAFPDGQQAFKDFTYRFIAQYILYGKAFIFKDSPQNASVMYNLPSDAIEPIYVDKRTRLAIKGYSLGKGEYLFDNNGFSQIFGMNNFNPDSAFEGQSPLYSCGQSVDIVKKTLQWNYKTLQQGARPSGFFTVKTTNGEPVFLNDAQHAKIKEQIENGINGINNVGRSALLDGGLEFIPTQMPAQDMEFFNSQTRNIQLICSAFGVPSLLVLPTESTYANLEQANLQFYQSTIIPLANRYFDLLSGNLLPENIRVSFFSEQIPAVANQKTKAMLDLNNLNYLTPNEKRKHFGFPDIDGGDVITNQLGIPIGESA
jgi:HK97 family phage portal protein